MIPSDAETPTCPRHSRAWQGQVHIAGGFDGRPAEVQALFDGEAE